MIDLIKLYNQVCKDCKVECCKQWPVFLSEYDKERIRKVNKSKNLFRGNYFNVKNKRCPFYELSSRKCKIYQYRPLDCRIYPYSFWFEFGNLELWLDLKCKLSKHLITNRKYYNQAMKITKSELVYWSEGEIFAYLIEGFDIEKFKKQVRGRNKVEYYKK